MSLKFRVLGSIAALLLLSLLAGTALLSVHAHALVDLEVRTAFNGAAQSVRDTLRSDVQHTVTLREVVSSFQGQRHVRAALVNESGKVIVQSQIGPLSDPAGRRKTKCRCMGKFQAKLTVTATSARASR